jgi:hypothetical protein
MPSLTSRRVSTFTDQDTEGDYACSIYLANAERHSRKNNGICSRARVFKGCHLHWIIYEQKHSPLALLLVLQDTGDYPEPSETFVSRLDPSILVGATTQKGG